MRWWCTGDGVGGRIGRADGLRSLKWNPVMELILDCCRVVYTFETGAAS